MSAYERASGPVEIAGPTGRIIDVGGRHVEGDGYGERSGHYPTGAEFMSTLRADERSLEEAKKHVAAMSPRWRDQRRQRAEAPFEEWKAERLAVFIFRRVRSR
jgi:hypothetical protein